MLEFGRKKAVNRKDKILKAIWDLGGFEKGITTRQISEQTGLNTNGLSQTLGRMVYDVDCLGGRGGEREWKLKNIYPATLD